MQSPLFTRALVRFALAVRSCIVALLSATTMAHAHPGHGMPGDFHWHSTDVWGFIVAGGLMAFIVWLKGRE